MTISTTTRRLQFDGTGTNATLTISYEFFVASDLSVIRRVTATGVETTMVLTTDYTVTGGSGSTGSVIVVGGTSHYPHTVTWTVTRTVPLTQLTDWVENDAFPAESHETAADRVVMIAQDTSGEVGRALKYPTGDTIGTNSTIPNSVDRASKYLAFDSSS